MKTPIVPTAKSLKANYDLFTEKNDTKRKDLRIIEQPNATKIDEALDKWHCICNDAMKETIPLTTTKAKLKALTSPLIKRNLMTS